MFQGKRITVTNAVEALAKGKTIFASLPDTPYAWIQVTAIAGPLPLDWDNVPLEEDRMWNLQLANGQDYQIVTEDGWTAIGCGLYLQE